jgi:tetratricopeptide (TPR) repeat protein
MLKERLMLSLIFIIIFSYAGIAQYKSSHMERRADRHYENQSYNKASRLYQKLINKRPNHEGVRLKLARTYFKCNELLKAETLYSQLIQKKYLVSSIDYLNYARILRSLEKFSSAAKWAKMYLSRDPRNVTVQNLIYDLENRMKNYQESNRYVVL